MSASEYLDDENLSSLPSEGENSKAPRLRHAARTDPALSDGAKVLFDHLTDQSFLDSVSPARGVVKMSKKKLGEHLHRSERTIARHAVELEGKRFIWTRTVWMGGFELTLWHIRGIADAQTELWNDGADPSWGTSRSGQRRTAARDSSGQFCPKGAPKEKTTETPTMSTVDGQKCPPTTDNPDHRQRTDLTANDGQSCPQSTVKVDRPLPSGLSEANGQNCPPTTVKVDRYQRTKVSEFKEPVGTKETRGSRKGEGEAPPVPGLEEFKKQWQGSFKRERDPMVSKLRADMATAAEADRPWFQARIDFLKWMDTGGRPPAPKSSVPQVKPKAPVKPTEEPTREELLESARYLVSVGKDKQLTPKQRALLKEGK